MQNNMRIVYDNLVDTASVSASSTAGSLSVSNLKTNYKTQVWRSVGTSATLTVLFNEAEFISYVGLPFCNLTSDSTMQVRIYSDTSGTNLVYDSGVFSGAPPTSFGSINFGFVPLGVNYYAYLNAGTYAYHWVDPVAVGQRVEITLEDPTNVAGYIESARLVIGAHWSPVINTSYGSEVGFIDNSQQIRTAAGDTRTYNSFKTRTLTLDLEALDDSEIATIQSIVRSVAKSKPILISVYPQDDDSSKEQAYQIFGKQPDVNSFTIQYYDQHSTTITIEEF